MAQEVPFVNSFSGGLNKDIDKRLQQPNTYRDAKNIAITGEDGFFCAKNINGSLKLKELLTGFTIANLISNGEFDTDLTGWGNAGSGATWAWDAGAAKATKGGDANTKGLYQLENLVSGIEYNFKITVTNNEAPNIGVFVNVAADIALSGNVNIHFENVGIGTTEIEFNYTMLASYPVLYFSCGFGGTAAQEVTIDNVEVIQVLQTGQFDLSYTPNILGAFECIGLYEAGTYTGQTADENNQSIIYFTVHYANEEYISTIYLYDIKRDASHTLYQGTDLAFPREGTIDAHVFGEKNYSNVYFIDYENELRKVSCIVPTTVTSIRDISMRPYAPVDSLSYEAVETGGYCQSGTYQFSYRYYNTTTKKYTTWSLLTNPIPIYPTDFDVEDKESIIGGLPGEATNKKIKLSIDLTAANAQYYNAIQLAVVKNISGNKIPETVAYTTSINSDWYDSPDAIYYDGMGKESLISISELVVEDAPIKSFKTLTVKDNVLFGGNIKYNDLSAAGSEFTDAYTIKQAIGNTGVYKPIEDNTNSPTITHPDGNDTEADVNGIVGTWKRSKLIPKKEDLSDNDLAFAGCVCASDASGSFYQLVRWQITDVTPGNVFRWQISYKENRFRRCDGASNDSGQYGFHENNAESWFFFYFLNVKFGFYGGIFL
jgi:hypothetical protein